MIETGWAVLRAGGCGRPDWQVKNCFFLSDAFKNVDFREPSNFLDYIVNFSPEHCILKTTKCHESCIINVTYMTAHLYVSCTYLFPDLFVEEIRKFCCGNP